MAGVTDSPPVILVVDDDPDLRTYLKRIIQRDIPGAEVVLAPDGAHALGELGRRTMDLVLTDQRMGAMSGVDLLVRVRESSPHMPRVLLTAFADVDVALRAVNAGHVSAFYLKSVDASELTARLRKLLEERRSVEQRETAFARASELGRRKAPFTSDLTEDG